MDDDDGTKVPLKQHQPPPPNRILPTESESENQRLLEHAIKFEVPTSGDMEGTMKQGLAAPLVKQTLTTVTQRPEKTIEGIAQKWTETGDENEKAFFIVLKQQQLQVYEGDSSKGQQLHQFLFPHGAEYRFFEDSDEKLLKISDQNGQKVNLKFQDEQLYQNLFMEWCNKKLFSDEKQTDENTYSFTFNPPISSEIGNIYSDKCLNAFQYYSTIDGKLHIEKGVNFKHEYIPNRAITSFNQEDYEEIEKHMKERKILQWAPSRDWSWLFMVSVRQHKDNSSKMYIEFYDFNREEQNNLFSPKRLNLLCQLVRPKWIQEISMSNDEIEQCKYFDWYK